MAGTLRKAEELESIPETLGREVADLGIKVTVVSSGEFRTNWAGSSMRHTPRPISDYDAMFDPVRERRHQGAR